MAKDKMKDKKEGIFISKKGEISFEGELGFEETIDVMKCLVEVQKQLLEHIIKQYGVFGIACAERGAAQSLIYADEDGKIEKDKLWEVVEECYKDLNKQKGKKN